MAVALDTVSLTTRKAAFLHRPTFKAHLHVEVLDDDRLLCLGSGQYVVLTGRPYVLVAPLVDGQRTPDDIVDLLAGQLSPSEAYHALLLLQRNNLIEETIAAVPAPVAAFWNALDYETAALRTALDARCISVTAFGNVPLRSFEERLARLDIKVRSSETADLWVALADDYLQPELDAFNQRALKADRPWLLVRPNGRFVLVGPLFHPPRTGCWSCLAQRLRSNREVEHYAQGLNGHGRPYPERGMLPTTIDIALGMAGTEVAQWLVTGRSETVFGKIVSFDTISYQTEKHALVRRPQCPDCGDADSRPDRAPAPIALRNVPKALVADGGHRAMAPEEALRRYEHHVSPITGVVKGLTRITKAQDTLHHVYLSSNNMAARHDSLQRLRRNLRGSCCGKGVTDAQARASALFEAVERYSGVFRGEDEIRRRASLRQLGEQAIDPRACMLYSEAQYRDRDRWNAHDQRLDWVPLPFDEHAEIEWTPLWSLTHREFRYLPTSYLYYSYPGAPEHAFFLPNSNGSAAGTSLEDAILQGFLELVERDAVALWWYNRLRRPAVDLVSFDEPFVHQLKRSYNDANRDLWVLDLTSDLGIPAFVAISRRIDRAVEDVIFAPAAHLDPRIGVIRALTELNQMLPGVADSTPDGRNYGYNDPAAVEWWRTATVEKQPWLKPAGTVPPTRKRDFPAVHTADLKEDVELCQSIADRLGFEMLVLDQTRLDVGVPVVKVVVPGLRHFWARFAPGRLYDVPVQMGWLAWPVAEEELNPVEVFI